MTLKNLSVPIYVIAFGVVIAGLVLGRGFLIPIAISIVIWNILSALIGIFERARLPTWLAAIFSVISVVFAVFLVFQILATQAEALEEMWPSYVQRLEHMFSDLAARVGPEFERYVREALSKIDLRSQIAPLLGSAGAFLSGLLLAILYTGFMFVEVRHAPQKTRALARNQTQVENISKIFEEIKVSLRSYFGVKTAMSVLVALVSYVVFRGIGLDFAETWAFLVFLLNFIPNIGSVIAVIFPALLALVQFDEIWPFLMISVVLTAAQMIIGNVLEPMFMGRTLNISALVVMLSLVFWGMIWGVVGMFLAVPLTVVVMICCANLPNVRWVAILLSQNGKLGSKETTQA